MAKRKSDIILKSVNDLKDEIDYKDFEYKEYFNLLCELVPNNSLEKLEINAIDEKNMKNEGLVYVFVIQGKIFKIGHSITPITKRVQSYKIVQVYAFFPEQPTYTLFGKTYQDSFSTSKRAENVILENFIKNHNKKPIGCTQT
ncbi:restriction endonuclease [Helicobacter pylori NQ4200]|uniref:Restriction endonuclease n=1 Tax=Helicobacter pylori NQ4200 TaxID=992024 RepID=I9Q6P8_HELPX|nr:hypothetical protein [Helicobacter pylori]EJB30191.1 restriction endonuclease [Helicobacter pylori NQ4200]